MGIKQARTSPLCILLESISEFGGVTLRVEDSFLLVAAQERDSAPKLWEL